MICNITTPRVIRRVLARLMVRRDVPLEEWPIDRLLRLAAWLADPLPLGWCPGWYFGLGDSSPDPCVQLRKRLWKHFAAIQAGRSFAMSWYCGLRVWLYLGNDLSWALFVGGAYEPNAFAFLAMVLKAGMTFIDIGANEGLYATFAARWVGSGGRVIAVEPSHRERTRLLRNLRSNRLENVIVAPLAASNANGDAVLRLAGYGHEGHNTLGAFIYDTVLAGTETVRMVRLDDLIRENGVQRVDAMKIDVEGAELRVLQGACDILRRDQPILIIELNDASLRHQGAGSDDVLRLLKEHGYRSLIFDPTTGRPIPGERPPQEDPNIIALPMSFPIPAVGGEEWIQTAGCRPR